MDIQIIEKTAQDLVEYARVPIAFKASSRIDLDALLEPTPQLVEQPCDGLVKDYDVYEKPSHWAMRWDLSNWLILMAYDESTPVAGAVVAWNTEGVDMLEGRSDLAVLWDIRVHPAYRGRGIGSLVFDRVVAWAKERGCIQLNVETQDNNPAACRFYWSRGCRPLRIVRNAYDDFPEEAMIIWSISLSQGPNTHLASFA
jgi:ribosomal protein S18 acetylase RimI-like enzyme